MPVFAGRDDDEVNPEDIPESMVVLEQIVEGGGRTTLLVVDLENNELVRISIQCEEIKVVYRLGLFVDLEKQLQISGD